MAQNQRAWPVVEPGAYRQPVSFRLDLHARTVLTLLPKLIGSKEPNGYGNGSEALQPPLPPTAAVCQTLQTWLHIVAVAIPAEN